MLAIAPKAEAAEKPIETVDIDATIKLAAARYSVDEVALRRTLTCESKLDPKAVGDHSTSFGIAQLHLPAHPEITKHQALDPTFSIDFMAHEFSKGRAHAWTCARMLGYS